MTGDDAVEGLFARLRAGHSAAGSPEGNQPAAETPPVEEDPPPAGAAEPAATAPTKPPSAATPPPRPPTGGAAEGPAEDGPTADEPDESGETDPDEPVRARRAELLDPIVTRLARRVKRALQDDQNRLLDRLRNDSGAWPTSSWSPRTSSGPSTSRRRRRSSGTRWRPAPPSPGPTDAGPRQGPGARREDGGRGGRGAGRDGGRPAAAPPGRPGRPRTPTPPIGWAPPTGSGGGNGSSGWSGTAPWGRSPAGVLAATGREAGLRWVVGGAGPACADCDDNALAGTVATGEEFPTGHRHPPAHAGCRCLVVPTPA